MTDIYVFNLTLSKEQVDKMLAEENPQFNSAQIKYLGEWWDLARTDMVDDVVTIPDDVGDPTPAEWVAAHNALGARVRRWEAEDGTHRHFAVIDLQNAET